MTKVHAEESVPHAGSAAPEPASGKRGVASYATRGGTLLQPFCDPSEEQAFQLWAPRKRYQATSAASRLMLGQLAGWLAVAAIYAVAALLAVTTIQDGDPRAVSLGQSVLCGLYCAVALLSQAGAAPGLHLWHMAAAAAFICGTAASSSAAYFMESGRRSVEAICLLAVLSCAMQTLTVRVPLGAALRLVVAHLNVVMVYFLLLARTVEDGASAVALLAMWFFFMHSLRKDDRLLRLEFEREQHGAGGECSSLATSNSNSSGTDADTDADAGSRGQDRDDGVQSLSPPTIVAADLELGLAIGEGQFGQVLRAKYRGEDVAVKVYNLDGANGGCARTEGPPVDDVRELMANESRISNMLRHPNVICFFGVGQQLGPGQACLVSSYAPLGTMEDVLNTTRFCRESVREQLLSGVCSAMRYLHGHHCNTVIIHHDLKPSNVLVDANLSPKLADFGVSKLAARDPARPQHCVPIRAQTGVTQGSPMWLPPEVHRGELYDETLDVYSFSLILCEAMVGDGLYVPKSFNATKRPLAELVNQGFRPPVPESVRSARPGLVHLMERCWDEDRTKRPSFREIQGVLAQWKLAIERGEVCSNVKALGGPALSLDTDLPTPTALLGGGTIKEGISEESAEDGPEAEGLPSGWTAAAADTAANNASAGPESPAALERQASAVTTETYSNETDPVNSISNASPRSTVLSGRAFDLFTPKGEQASLGNAEVKVMQRLCDELQLELKQQAEAYETKLQTQQQEYERKLDNLAAAVL